MHSHTNMQAFAKLGLAISTAAARSHSAFLWLLHAKRLAYLDLPGVMTVPASGEDLIVNQFAATMHQPHMVWAMQTS